MLVKKHSKYIIILNYEIRNMIQYGFDLFINFSLIWTNNRRKKRKEMCGIFAYLNCKVSRKRKYILQTLFNGMKRLEYRGYDAS